MAKPRLEERSIHDVRIGLGLMAVGTGLAGRMNRIFIFERDESKGTTETYLESAQLDLLPKCQVVFITSSTLINETLEPILEYCTNARDIVMVGSSTPL